MRKVFFGIIISVLSGLMYVGADMIPGAFVTTWKTDNTGGVSNQIVIPIQGVGYNYNVYWSGVDNAYTGQMLSRTAATTITFPSTGIYQVQITGNFPQIYINNSATMRQKLLSIDQWGTGVWRSMANAFYGANNLVINAIDVPNLTNVTTLAQMFRATTNLVDNGGAMNNWNTSSITNMSSMFLSATNFNSDIGNWDTSKVTAFNGMFQLASTFNQPLNDWNTSSGTNMANMFDRAVDFNQSLNDWDMSNVTNLSYMFRGLPLFNQPLNNWDTSSGTTMTFMFNGATAFNQPLNDWDVSNVTNMINMFWGATAFNQPLNEWDVSNVTNMQGMFSDAITFNQPLNDWDITSLKSSPYMFQNAISFNQPLDKWDTSSVTHMGFMFNGATIFNQPLNDWNTSNVTAIYAMFSGAVSFNQPLDQWNTSSGTNMELMFQNAVSFDQDVSSWNIENMTNIKNAFTGATLSTVHYDALLNSREQQDVATGLDFHAGYSKYCLGENARNILLGKGWTIGDGGKQCFIDFILTNTNIIESNTVVGNLSGLSLTGGNYSYGLVVGTGDEDNELFSLTGNTLEFILSPEYNNPKDQGDGVGNNTYSIRIRATHSDGEFLEKIFTIIVGKQITASSGGGGYTIPQTHCSNNNCGTVSATGDDLGNFPEIIFNPSISTTCFSPLNKKTIDQGNNVTQAFKIAHQMLYSYKLTMWRGTVDYRPYDYLTREEAARFMVEFAENVLCRKKTRIYEDNFSDIGSANGTLTKFITASYEYEIFNGDKIEDNSATTFRPRDRISNDELTAIMVRLVTNTILDEPEDDWANPYRVTLSRYARVSRLNDRGRGNIAEVIYDLYRNNQYELKNVGYVIK